MGNNKPFMQMEDKEILKMDFYDICGSSSIFMTDEDKIKCWRSIESILLKNLTIK